MAKKKFVQEKGQHVQLMERVASIALQPSSVVKELKESVYEITSERDGVITVAPMGGVIVCISFNKTPENTIDIDPNDEYCAENRAAFQNLHAILSNKSANMFYYMTEEDCMSFLRKSARGGANIVRNDDCNQWEWGDNSRRFFVRSSDMFKVSIAQKDGVIGQKIMLPTFGNMVPMWRLKHTLNMNYRICKMKERAERVREAALSSNCLLLSLLASRCK